MPNLEDVLKEINDLKSSLDSKSPWDSIRLKYLEQLHRKTGRNVIAYYSGWLQGKSGEPTIITDGDKPGFMNAIHRLDRKIGLDLLLHTPGGDFAATESLVNYLHLMFGKDIRCFIPQTAMSGGTMIACACKEIFMGKQSNLGPIDPQFGFVPAYAVINEFKEAIESVTANPGSAPIWQTIVGKYPPAFIERCRNAIALADEIVRKWLIENMFQGDNQAEEKANNIVQKLNNYKDTKIHERHIHANEAKEFGLKISMFEEDNDLQDLVLTIHHAYMHTFAACNAEKIIENHLGQIVVITNTP